MGGTGDSLAVGDGEGSRGVFMGVAGDGRSVNATLEPTRWQLALLVLPVLSALPRHRPSGKTTRIE